jgi:hypothetical protein
VCWEIFITPSVIAMLQSRTWPTVVVSVGGVVATMMSAESQNQYLTPMVAVVGSEKETVSPSSPSSPFVP